MDYSARLIWVCACSNRLQEAISNWITFRYEKLRRPWCLAIALIHHSWIKYLHDQSKTNKLSWSVKRITNDELFFCDLFMFILLWFIYVSAEQIKLTVNDLVIAGDLLGVVVMISIIMNIYTIFVVSKNWKTFVQVKISNLKFGYHNMLFALTI